VNAIDADKRTSLLQPKKIIVHAPIKSFKDKRGLKEERERRQVKN
jgi:hypothetical protein